jgi:hypothetical protein
MPPKKQLAVGSLQFAWLAAIFFRNSLLLTANRKNNCKLPTENRKLKTEKQ